MASNIRVRLNTTITKQELLLLLNKDICCTSKNLLHETQFDSAEVKFEVNRGGRVVTVENIERCDFLAMCRLELVLQRFGLTTAAMGKDNGTHRGGFPPLVFTVIPLAKVKSVAFDR